MEIINLELASEYLVMAAILAEIKSRMLLPKPVFEQEEQDPRAELIKRLQAYEQVKKSAEQLDQIPRQERDFFLADLPDITEASLLSTNQSLTLNDSSISLNDLVLAMQRIIKQSEALAHHHIQKETLSTRDRMTKILDYLQINKQALFSQLFSINEGRAGVVVTFIAILELVKESFIVFLKHDNEIKVALS